MDLSRIGIAKDVTHHVVDGRPLYAQRYWWVLKYHPPGVAAAGDRSGAFHIDLSGRAAYERRFVSSFGFYENRAAVETEEGWGHIVPLGSLAYPPTFEWIGNFQEQRCTVRTREGVYYHIRRDGSPAYEARWRYAGDYKNAFACVQGKDGLYTHIDHKGKPIHGGLFLDLDVFHKGYARARDLRGWHHVDREGRPAYARRFVAIEPFYNGQARVEDASGALLVIDEEGSTIRMLRSNPDGRPAEPVALESRLTPEGGGDA